MRVFPRNCPGQTSSLRQGGDGGGAVPPDADRGARPPVPGADEVVDDPADLDGAVGDADVVVSAVGSTVTERRSGARTSTGAQNLLGAAVAAGVEAFVIESAIGDRTFEVVSRPAFRDRALAVDWHLG